MDAHPLDPAGSGKMSRRRFSAWVAASMAVASGLAVAGASPSRGDGAGALDPDVRAIVEDEVDRSIRWLWAFSNSERSSGGHGLVRDRDDSAWVASIAATGFAMAAFCVGVQRGILSRSEVTQRVRGALATLENSVPHRNGIMMHFVQPRTGLAAQGSEFSTIDTTLALNGAIVASSYLRDPEIQARTDRLLRRADWTSYVRVRPTRTSLSMGRSSTGALLGSWTMTAEQLTSYFLIAGHPGVGGETARALYRDFDRPAGGYGDHRCVYEPGGTMFVYQYSHSFFPFHKWRDASGFDWDANSRAATLANHAWCRDNASSFPTFADGLWGSSASDGPGGYTVNGSEPCFGHPRNDGTIPPYSLIAALVHAPAEASAALRVLRDRYPGAWGPYGLCDGVSWRGGRPWYSRSRLGIDKGLTVLSGSAALGSTLVWDNYDGHSWVVRGRKVLGFLSS